MKRLLLALALLCGLASAQVDIRINQIGPYFDLTRNAVWNKSGVGGFNNNYIFTPQSPDSGVCIYVYNNDAVNTYTPAFLIFQTGDQRVSTYTGNTGRWFQVLATNTLTVGPSGVVQFFFKTSGAASVAIVTSGGATNAGTVDLVAVQTQQGCGPRVNLPVSCTLNKTQAIASGVAATVVGNTTNATSIHVCSYSVSIGGATVTTATNAFRQGTNAGCSAATVNTWFLTNGAQNTIFALSGGAGELFEVGPSLNLCYLDGGTTAGSTISISYALF